MLILDPFASVANLFHIVRLLELSSVPQKANVFSAPLLYIYQAFGHRHRATRVPRVRVPKYYICAMRWWCRWKCCLFATWNATKATDDGEQLVFKAAALGPRISIHDECVGQTPYIKRFMDGVAFGIYMGCWNGERWKWSLKMERLMLNFKSISMLDYCQNHNINH